MKCYYHPGHDAVAQCSQCHKGVCSECAHDVGGTVLCPMDFSSGITEMETHARRRVIGAWVFTGIVGSINAIAAIAAAFAPSSSGAQPLGPVALLLVPVAYYGSWSLFWGWGPTWRVTRRFVGNGGCLGEGIVFLILFAVLIEFVLVAAVLVGAFTGIQRYQQERRVLARGPALRAMVS